MVLVRIVFRLALVAAAALVLLLLWTHWQIRQLDPPLPELEALRAVARHADLPIRLQMWNTASQRSPRAQVLDPKVDPESGTDYVMSHPAFLLEWADGRALLIDAGMDRDAARSFGRMLQWVGADALEDHGGIGEGLAQALAERPLAIVFTHLHTDHTQGVAALCRERGSDRTVRLFQGAEQGEIVNATTFAGRNHLADAGCLVREPLVAAALAPLPDHPGVAVVRAAGHTPGSQVIVAWVREPGGAPRGILFTGDVVNQVDGILNDFPKPALYRTFVVPESEARLTRMRRFLRDAAERGGFALAVSHDQRQLERIGIRPWGE